MFLSAGSFFSFQNYITPLFPPQRMLHPNHKTSRRFFAAGGFCDFQFVCSSIKQLLSPGAFNKRYASGEMQIVRKSETPAQQRAIMRVIVCFLMPSPFG
ncbi:MAG: hypothetical protein IKJ65_12195 [Clostridia bacterium]|nr:hypothetical protein [Clostridia bacterium]